MSALEKVTRKRKQRELTDLKQKCSPFTVGAYNHAVDDARKGIVPQNVINSYRKAVPEKQIIKKPEIPKFKLHDISKIQVFDKKQACKLLKMSLFTHAAEYDTLRSNYRIL